MSVSAIILSAGKGERAGFEKNKLLIELNGISALERSICCFCLPEVDEIVLAYAKRDEEDVFSLLRKYPFVKPVLGGETRMQSVFNALSVASGDIVLIHDGARPFVKKETVINCIESVKAHKSGIPAVPVSDTVVCLSSDGLSYPVRANTYAIQTPQGFLKDEILSCYQQAERDGKTFTDDSSLYNAYLGSPTLSKGDPTNKKLTYASDFNSETERVGFGVDTHAFGKDQPYILLGGVKIPCESGLVAHSDGDVLLHAVMDALLSAVGLHDIGHYFPDTDETYRGADSTLLTKTVLKTVLENGYRVKSLSVAVQAEKPKLKNYIDRIRENLASLLDVDCSAVGVSAGTNEKLGYVGEGKGITVYATVLMKKA